MKFKNILSEDLVLALKFVRPAVGLAAFSSVCFSVILLLSLCFCCNCKKGANGVGVSNAVVGVAVVTVA